MNAQKQTLYSRQFSKDQPAYWYVISRQMTLLCIHGQLFVSFVMITCLFFCFVVSSYLEVIVLYYCLLTFPGCQLCYTHGAIVHIPVIVDHC